MTQWNHLLQNLGQWQGSFTRFSPQGEEIEDISSLVSLEGQNNNKTIQQKICLFPPNEPANEKILEYSSLSRSILLFEDGSFSQGSMQWGPFSEFGAELGLKAGNERLRLVQLYNRESVCDRITLIREHLKDTQPTPRPHLTVEQLLGEWQGTAITYYPNLQPPDTYSTHLSLSQTGDTLQQKLSFAGQTLQSVAKINGSRLIFDQGTIPIHLLLLPNGASSNSPQEIKGGVGFVLEVGWLITPKKRHRLIRRYNDKGTWVSLTLVQEEKLHSS